MTYLHVFLCPVFGYSYLGDDSSDGREILHDDDTCVSRMSSPIIKIIIIIFISSAALSKIRRAAGTCHSVLTKRCVFRGRAKVVVDSVDRRSSAGKLLTAVVIFSVGRCTSEIGSVPYTQ